MHVQTFGVQSRPWTNKATEQFAHLCLVNKNISTVNSSRSWTIYKAITLFRVVALYSTQIWAHLIHHGHPPGVVICVA